MAGSNSMSSIATAHAFVQHPSSPKPPVPSQPSTTCPHQAPLGRTDPATDAHSESQVLPVLFKEAFLPLIIHMSDALWHRETGDLPQSTSCSAQGIQTSDFSAAAFAAAAAKRRFLWVGLKARLQACPKGAERSTAWHPLTPPQHLLPRCCHHRPERPGYFGASGGPSSESSTPLRTFIKITCLISVWVLYEQKGLKKKKVPRKL